MARVLLSERSDTTQLLGCFEQTSTDVSSFLPLLDPFKSKPELTQAILRLETALAQASSVKTKLKQIEEMLMTYRGAFGESFEELVNRLKEFKHGHSRFEWVDSVLVHMIEHGGWTVFENANLCNPSILDRLNSLLEEGNYSLTINEQGLVAGEQIRTIKAHRDFRPIFVISERTYSEQSKDVSRALRNRCQEIWLNFSQEE